MHSVRYRVLFDSLALAMGRKSLFMLVLTMRTLAAIGSKNSDPPV